MMIFLCTKTKKILNQIVIWIVVLLMISGCEQNPLLKGTERQIFVTFSTFQEWQIWKISLDHKQQEIVYRLPCWVSMNDSYQTGLFSQEMLLDFEQEYSNLIIEEKFETHISSEISPNKNLLAIKETYSYCPGNWCDGLFVLRIIDLETGVEKFNHESREPIENFQWSLDGNFILFEKAENFSTERKDIVFVFDIQHNQQVIKQFGKYAAFTGGGLPVIAGYENEISPGELICCQILDPAKAQVDFVYPTGVIQNAFLGRFVFSPDGKNFIIDSTQNNAKEIKIFNYPDFEFINSIEIGDEPFNISQVKWSPDGNLIGISGLEDGRYTLKIFDFHNGDLIKTEDAILDWVWGENGQDILYLTDDPENQCIQNNIKIGIMECQGEADLFIELPLEISDFIHNQPKNAPCITFIHEVNW